MQSKKIDHDLGGDGRQIQVCNSKLQIITQKLTTAANKYNIKITVVSRIKCVEMKNLIQ